MRPGDVVILNDPVRRRHAPARRHGGRAGARRPAAGRLRRQPRASRRHRRHEPGLDAAGDGDLPGRPAPAAGAPGARRGDRSRTSSTCSSPTRASPTSAAAICWRSSPRCASARRACASWSPSEGAARVRRAMRALQDYSERLMRAALRELPRGDVSGRRLPGRRRPGRRARAHRGRGAHRRRPRARRLHRHRRAGARRLNANFAVTLAAVSTSSGAWRGRRSRPTTASCGRSRVVAPAGTLVNARFPAAVAGGNVETSQRIVDVLLRALAARAARPHPGRELRLDEQPRLRRQSGRPERRRGAGAVLLLRDARRRRRRRPGACRRVGGAHAHDQHAEHADRGARGVLPVRVVRYAVRPRSGGRGRHRGRRRRGPRDRVPRPGAAHAADRAPRDRALRRRRRRRRAGAASTRSSSRGRRAERLPGKVSRAVQPGDRVRVQTPGGGGWGRPRR